MDVENRENIDIQSKSNSCDSGICLSVCSFVNADQRVKFGKKKDSVLFQSLSLYFIISCVRIDVDQYVVLVLLFANIDAVNCSALHF